MSAEYLRTQADRFHRMMKSGRLHKVVKLMETN
jgi:hypothetical protein